MARSKKWWALLGGILLVGLVWWALGGSGGSLGPSRTAVPVGVEGAGSGMRSAPRREARRPLEVRTVSDKPRPSEDAMTEAYARIAPDAVVVRCDVTGLLDDGHYEVIPPVPAHVTVQDGTLSMMVSAPSGSGSLGQRLMVEGRVSWEGETCAFQAPQWITIRGTLTRADGQPAVDYDVRACRFGEFVQTDGQGAWEMEGLAGGHCSPMAFVDREDGAFGKSTVGDVDVVAPGPITGVSLVLPSEADLWSPEMQRQLAIQLVAMSEGRLAMVAERLERVEKALESCDAAEDASCEMLEAWKEQEALWVNWMADETERLSDPEEQLDAVRDAWLNQY